MGNQQVKGSRDYGRKIDWKNAERPSPPGKPYLVPEEGNRLTDVITIRWSPPTTDGGAPIIGYIVEHKRTGSPHWLRATPDLTLGTQLPLTGLEPGWRYQFRVSAENEVGRSDPGELSETLTVTPQKWAASVPFFNVELQDIIGLENEKVEFKVQVIAIPPPTISWYKDGFEVFSSRRTKIITENDQSTFIIHQAALEDEGEIKCTATNRAGHAVTKANLKLEAPPRIRLPRQYGDGLIFEKGELIRLKITTAGRPRPQVTWYHNGVLLQKGGRFDITDSETGSMVKISDACRDDRGEYVIKGINKIGEDTTSFLVTVTDRPSPPGKVQITLFGRTVTLSWSSPKDDGGCKIGSYIVEYFRIGWDMWLKAKNSRQLSTIMEDLIEGSEYKFRVRAENPYGISEPSEESDVIFLPDPKRGILEPPPKKQTPEILRETKRHAENHENHKREEEEESKKRRLLEEKARKLLDTPLPILLPNENSLKTSQSTGDENTPPPVPKRRNKGKGKSTPSPNFSDGSSMTPSPVEGYIDKLRLTPEEVSLLNRQRLTPSPVYNDSSNTQRQTPSPLDSSLSNGQALSPSPVNTNLSTSQRRTPSPVSKTEETKSFGGIFEVNGTIQSADWVAKSEELRRSGQLKFNEQKPYNKEPSLYPRENDDSILHGSSELMLVLYPRDRSKSVELSAQQRSEIEMSLAEDSVAPPMSLSAPELGCTQIFEPPLMRDAVSSSELLYERTMARLYQDSIDEEAQKKLKRRYSMDRKSVERRASLKEPLEKRLSFKEETKPNESSIQLKEKSPVNKNNIKKTEEFQSMIPKPLTNGKARERLSSVERERLEFALVRERLKKKEEEQKQGVFVNHGSETPTTTTSSSVEADEYDDEDEEYEDDDDEELEEEEDEYYLDENKKKEEVDEEDFDMDEDLSKFKRPPIVQSLTLPIPIRIAPRAEQEDDTYHPRSMIPTRSIISKLETQEVKESNKIPRSLSSTESTTSPLSSTAESTTSPSPSPQPLKKEITPPKTSKIPVLSERKIKKTSKILKKFGLKKDKKIPEVMVAPVDPNLPPVVVPKPILKNKTLAKKRESPKSLLKFGLSKPTDKSISEEESEGEFSGRKKKQVRIAEPKKDENLQNQEQKPVDENAIENQVLIYHYSDIVKEFGANKKPPTKLYLNYDELKAHATPEEPATKKNLIFQENQEQKVDDMKIIPTTITEVKNVLEIGSFYTSPPKIEEQIPKPPQERTKIRTSMEYITDVILFIIACWLYLFKCELYAIPILCVMAYRQIKDMTVEKYTKLKTSISKFIPAKLRGKSENENK